MSLFGSILDVPNRKGLPWHTMLLTTQIFNILATITAPLFKSTDPNIKLDTNATLSLANLVASHINRRYKAVPTKSWRGNS